MFSFQDLGNKLCPKTGSACSGQCHASNGTNGHVANDDKIFQMRNWYRPESLDQLTELFKSFDANIKYRLVAGNTGTGIPLNTYIFFYCYIELHRLLFCVCCRSL